jgi:hypothetical protein
MDCLSYGILEKVMEARNGKQKWYPKKNSGWLLPERSNPFFIL